LIASLLYQKTYRTIHACHAALFSKLVVAESAVAESAVAEFIEASKHSIALNFPSML